MFSVDDNITLGTWNTIAVEWFRGINSVLGVNRTGIYGHSRACAWAIQDGVVGQSATPGRHWVWRTRAWSFGEREPAAVLYQDVIDTASNPGPLVGGIRVDENQVLAADFGQWGSTGRLVPRQRRRGGYPGAPTMRARGVRDVVTVQERLNAAAGAGLLIDGEYGPVTGRAVEAFQRGRG